MAHSHSLPPSIARLIHSAVMNGGLSVEETLMQSIFPIGIHGGVEGTGAANQGRVHGWVE